MTKKNGEIEPSFTSEGGARTWEHRVIGDCGENNEKIGGCEGLSVASYFWTVSMPFILEIITSMPFQFIINERNY